MARSISEIKQEITDKFMADATIQRSYGFATGSSFDTVFSKVSLESIIFYTVATCMWALEVLFDTHRSDVEAQLAAQQSHTLSWYETVAKGFMFGKQPIPFSKDYDTTGMTEEEIAQARIVTYAACTRGVRESGRIFLLLKVAKGTDDLAPLTAGELAAFTDYILGVCDAGLDIECISTEADRMRMQWDVYYNPQILDPLGNRLDATGNDVVKNAIKGYLKQLSFNGQYIPTYHTDALQKVQGVQIPVIKSVKTSQDSGSTWSAVPDTGVIPRAGWCEFSDDSDLEIVMIPFGNDEDI